MLSKYNHTLLSSSSFLPLSQKQGSPFKEPTYDWASQARPEQLPPPGDWFSWMILAGRGFGKTRAGAETVRQWITGGKHKRIALIGHTEADAREVMIQGESGLLNVFPEGEKPTYQSSRRLLTWPNGAIAMSYSADRYDQLRGPQFDGAWIDELAKFRNPEATWNHLMLALRLGEQPRVIITTTPRPIPFIKKLLRQDSGCLVTRGSTFDNKNNLSPIFLEQIRKQYEGTSLEAQEIYAQVLDTQEDLLWQPEDFQYDREGYSSFKRIVIALDPTVQEDAQGDETGIIVAALGANDKGYILGDYSGPYTPALWAAKVVSLYHQYKAHEIIAEINNGGHLITSMIQTLDQSIRVKPVWAKTDKKTRSIPISFLYQQRRIIHLKRFEKLEHQMLHFGQKQMPDDRVDALVWALTGLFILPKPSPPPLVMGSLSNPLKKF